MANLYIKNYSSKLSISETQQAIVLVKDYFLNKLSNVLGLTRVSAPMFVDPGTGLNDNLNGFETAVNFTLSNGQKLEIVHSLAKWKRQALKTYDMSGLVTDMNAIRQNEDLDNVHSLYVDQWDWEKVITKEQRNISFLKEIVNKIFSAIKDTEKYLNSRFEILNDKLPDSVHFISSQDLLDLYPTLNAKEREKEIVKKYKAVFIIGIGNKLSNGLSHDGRAADYDDWKLNGDLLVWDEVIDSPLELTSMGIRVDASSLKNQLEAKGEVKDSTYHRAILSNELPLTIGGGIGQSRLSMFLLEKAHIGEVQSSYWNKKDIEEFAKFNIYFL